MIIDPEKRLREARKKRKPNTMWIESMVIHFFFISFTLFVLYKAWPYLVDWFMHMKDVLK